MTPESLADQLVRVYRSGAKTPTHCQAERYIQARIAENLSPPEEPFPPPSCPQDISLFPSRESDNSEPRRKTGRKASNFRR